MKLKFPVALFFMVMIVIGISAINAFLGNLLHIDTQPREIYALWFLYCVFSGMLTGWFGAKYMFSQFFK